MPPPPIPADEAHRLEALRLLNLTDPRPDPRLDRITRLAQRILRVPIALVSLIEAQELHVKSAQGLEPMVMPREAAFCSHTIVEQGALLVEDATTDERFADLPVVTEPPHLRFYAGAALHWPTVESGLGTLCLLDTQPRTLDADELAILTDLAGLAEDVLKALALEQVTRDCLHPADKSMADLMTLCAWCRRVRDDPGSWRTVESYLSRHGGVQVTHGMCPDCAERMESGPDAL